MARPSNGGAGGDGTDNAGSGAAGDSGATGDAGSAIPGADTANFSLPPGRIRVTTWLQYGETELVAAFADGPTPRQHEESQRVGSCRLMTFRASTCTPGCEGGALCISERCESFPRQLNRGPLEWSWPDGQQTISASATGHYHGVGQASSVGNVSVAVADISLSAPIDENPSPQGDWQQVLRGRAGADATLRWTNPRPGARVRLHMTDCAATHGSPAAAEIECEAIDSGQLVIAGTILDALDAGDWSRGECGGHRLERYFVDGDDQLRLETIASADFSYRP